jgi:hypothetical protein
VFQTTYTTSPFSGVEQIQVVSSDASLSVTLDLTVQIAGLQPLPAGTGYQRCCSKAVHPDSHNGTTAANDHLVAIGVAYAAQYPGSVLLYNDMSLPNGGLFDIGPPYGQLWQTPHSEHRLGLNCDVDKNSETSSRSAFLEDLFGLHSPNLLDEGSHWHLRF